MLHTLGGRIGQARRELSVREHRDVTQSDLAKAVGVTATSVSEWEADKKVPREAALAKLAAYLGVTPAYLRYGITHESPAPVPVAERAPAELPPMDMGEDGRVWAANERKRKATREGGQTKKRRA